jgi:ribosomal protein L11 methyltransferase
LRCRVLATDIDRSAIVVARENARLNRAANAIRFVTAAGLTAGALRRSKPFDLVFANILLDPLKLIAGPMARLTRRDTLVILSGLLPQQANAALSIYRAHGFVLSRRVPLDGWMTLVLVHRCGKRDHPRPAGTIAGASGRRVSRA